MVKSQFLRLDGFTRCDRLQMTARISEAINQSDAWITDFHQYSNIVLCINFQIPATHLAQLATALVETGLHLSQESLDQLTPPDLPSSSEQEYSGTLQITFIHDEPDLLREIPAIPG